MGEPIKIDDLARRMIRLSGFTVRCGDAQADDHSIEIRYIGLRPGEKLYEELCLEDGLTPTENPKVFRADEKFLSWLEVEEMIVKIRKSIESHDPVLFKRILEEYVTGYESK
jgi:FlaA1/EpsC-like NDP-sugar epimerase